VAEPPGPDPDQDHHDVPDWCVCHRCLQMPTVQERLCCQQQPARCFSQLPGMDTVVLDREVLEVARRHRNDILGDEPEVQDLNRAFRHAAYRQYVLWRHGRLGEGDRRVIPACCVWRVRNAFPEPTGQYVGFIAGRFG
jgi:hypothetical protein